MQEFCNKLRAVFVGGVIPLEIRESYAKLIKGESVEIFIPYVCNGFWSGGVGDKFLHSEGVEFNDCEVGVTAWPSSVGSLSD